MLRKRMNKFAETCKHYPLFEVLNRDKKINCVFLDTHGELVTMPIVVTGASKVMAHTETCETHVSW